MVIDKKPQNYFYKNENTFLKKNTFFLREKLIQIQIKIDSNT